MDDLSRACDAWKKKYEKAASELKDKDREIALQPHALQKKEQKILELVGMVQEKDALLRQVKENRNVFRIKQRIKKIRFSFLGSLRINT